MHQAKILSVKFLSSSTFYFPTDTNFHWNPKKAFPFLFIWSAREGNNQPDGTHTPLLPFKLPLQEDTWAMNRLTFLFITLVSASTEV